MIVPALLATGLSTTIPVSAASTVLHNRGTTNNAQVDANIFINSGQFTIVDLISGVPYSTLNTDFFTNTQSGTMSFTPGVVFELITNNNRIFMDTFANFGQISAAGVGRIDARANNIIAHGRINSLTGGRIRLEGKNIDVERGSLQAVVDPSVSFDSVDLRPTNYVNQIGVEDVYWGAGGGGRMTTLASIPITLTGNPFPVPPATLSSPVHEVIWPAFTNLSYTNFFSQSNYASYIWTNQVGTNFIIQVVLVNTNQLAPNISAEVRFQPGLNVATPIARYSLVTSNLISSALETNRLYFVDTSTSQTNATLADNVNGIHQRPRSFKISRGNAFDSDFDFFSVPSNSVQQFDTFFPAGLNFTNQFTTNYRYWAYGAKIGNPRTNALPTVANGSNLSLTDATNKPGRIEIFGDNVNLKLARLQAENTIIISTTNLVNSEGARFDAPNLVFNVARENDTIVLNNFVPQAVTNFHGFIRAYSAVWTNISSAGERYSFEVLLLDGSLLDQQASVTIPTLNVRATNIVVQNKLNAARSFIFDAQGLTFDTGTELRMDVSTIPNFLPTNFPRMVNFTNRGIITVPGLADIVGGVSSKMVNYINDGILLASTLNIECENFESSGTNGAFNFTTDATPATFQLLSLSTGGPLSISASAAKLQANTSAGRRGRQVAVGDITMRGNSLKLIGQDIMTPARFTMDVTNLISDGSGIGSNTITVGRGFSFLQKPGLGDLLGTSIETVIPHDFVIDHHWPASNLGKTVAGYTNNLALGKLIINTTNRLGQPYLVRMFGTGSSNAMYVDLLDLRGSITNEDLAVHLEIETNLTIYFANASPSVEQVLNAVTNASNTNLRDRIVWVPDFTGPNSSQPFSFIDVNGNVVQTVVNAAKFNSQFLDSDGDGVVNAAEDRLNSGTPFDGVLMRSRIGFVTNLFTNVFTTNGLRFTNVGVSSTLSAVTWRAARETTYRVEATSNFTNGWTLVTNIVNGSLTDGDFTYTNELPANTSVRFYRVGYLP
jgi:hypothetical protein